LEEIEVIFYIEGLGNEKKALESALRETADNLQREKGVRVEYARVEEVLEDPEADPLKYSGMIEAKLRGPLDNVIHLTLNYSPAIVEVIRPGRMEIDSKELMKLLGEISLFMKKLMEEFGGLAVYPKLDDVPAPRIGYEREEIEELIVSDRNVRYRLVIEVFGEDEEGIRETMAKALAIEGCRINALVVQGEKNDGEFKGFLAAELLSPIDILFQLVGKYAPVAISVLEPEIVDITANELQNILTDLGGFVNELVTRPVRKVIMDRQNTTFKLK